MSSLDVRATSAKVTPGRHWDPGRFGSCTAFWDPRDPNIQLTGALVDLLPNRRTPGTYDLSSAGISRPTFEAAGWLGQPSILFDGVTQCFGIANPFGTSLSGEDIPWSVVMAIQIVTHTAGRAVMHIDRPGFANTGHLCRLAAGNSMDIHRHDDAGGEATQVGTTAMTSRCIWAMSYDRTAVSTFVNGVVDINGLAMDVGVMTTTDGLIGCDRAGGVLGNYSNIRLGGVTTYSNALSADAVLAASRAMAAVWPRA